MIGCPLSGISQKSTSEELRYYAKKSEAQAAVCTEENFYKLEGVFPSEKVLVFGSAESGAAFGNALVIPRDLPAWSEGAAEGFRNVHIECDSLLLMPFSSGTGGKPRCVKLTHRNYSAATAILKMALFDKLVADSRRRTVAVLPFYHASGFWALLYCILEGCHSVIMKSFHPISMLEIIHKHQVDTLNVVPSIVSFLCRVDRNRFDLSSVKTVLCGSSPLGKELSNSFLEKFTSVQNLIQGYGMTEIVVLSHITPLGVVTGDHLGSCGRLLPGFEAQLRDENGEIISTPHQPGELYLKSPTVMLGYHDADDELNPFFDGWLRTGDVLYRDEDDFYYVVDRVKDLIKVNGIQVSSSELEDVILMVPSVKEVGVVGIDDPGRGQVPKAFLVLDDSADVEESIRSILAEVKARLSPDKQLHGGIELVAELPKTSSGKVKRSELRKASHYL